MLSLSSKTFRCYGFTSDKIEFSSKSLNTRVQEQINAGALKKFWRFLDEKKKIKSTNRSFRSNNCAVATYDKIDERLSSF